jgi:transcriptional regulator with XRE-family HTH domain
VNLEDLKGIGERIAEERRFAGLNQRQLADRSGLSQPTLARIELGERKVLTVAEVDRLAQALSVPITRLTRPNPVARRMRVAARAAGDAEQALRRAARHAEEILTLDDRMDPFLSPKGAVEPEHPATRRPACDLPSAALPPEEQGRTLADSVRAALGLGIGPLTDLTEPAERHLGVDTAFLDLPAGVSGFTALDPVRDVTLVIVNTGDVPERQRFTLAHELGHVLFGDGTHAHRVGGERTPEEKRCDAFARHLLAPAEGVRRWMGGHTGERGPGRRECAMAARHFEVSLKVLLIQCKGLGLLTDGQAGDLEGPTGRELAWSFGWGPEYEATLEAARRVRPPRRILERAVSAYQVGHIGVRAVALLGGQDAHQTERELTDAGIAPPAPPAPRRLDVGALVARRTGRPPATPPTSAADGGAHE